MPLFLGIFGCFLPQLVISFRAKQVAKLLTGTLATLLIVKMRSRQYVDQGFRSRSVPINNQLSTRPTKTEKKSILTNSKTCGANDKPSFRSRGFGKVGETRLLLRLYMEQVSVCWLSSESLSKTFFHLSISQCNELRNFENFQ